MSRPPRHSPGRRLPLTGLSRSNANGTAPLAPRLAVAGVVVLAIIGVLILRLWALTVISGADYAARADSNHMRQLPVQAPRGKILDRNGKAIVINRDARQVVLDLQDVPVQRRPELYRSLAAVLDIPVHDVTRRVKRGAPDPLEPIVIADDITELRIIYYLEEHARDFPGVDVRTSYVRNYVKGVLGAHFLGQVGEVSPEELKSQFANLIPGNMVGKSGLEYSYDEYLRGKDGYRRVEVDAAGTRQSDGRGLPATPGRDLRTTIDAATQHATEQALAAGVRAARVTHDGRHAKAGAAVMLDVKTGGVISMASYPDFNPNIFVEAGHDKEIKRLFADKMSPQIDRATSGVYPPGSVFKPVTGIAAMEEGYVTAGEELPCPGSMKIVGTTFTNWTTENMGSMDLPRALEASCDTYFYRLGINFNAADGSPLAKWSHKLGLGEKTGIDVPEEVGVVPTPEWKKKAYSGAPFSAIDRIWKPGDSINMSIGQGLVLVTPLQMTRLYAAIADNGTMRQPHIGGSVLDPAGRELIKLPVDDPVKLNLKAGELAAVQKGLQLVTNGPNGTATSVFSTFSVPTAGKTGTAEKPPYGNAAWYCGYAPVHQPQIAACAMVDEGGHGGSIAAPIVLKMFQQYFDTKTGSVKGEATD